MNLERGRDRYRKRRIDKDVQKDRQTCISTHEKDVKGSVRRLVHLNRRLGGDLTGRHEALGDCVFARVRIDRSIMKKLSRTSTSTGDQREYTLALLSSMYVKRTDPRRYIEKETERAR